MKECLGGEDYGKVYIGECPDADIACDSLFVASGPRTTALKLFRYEPPPTTDLCKYLPAMTSAIFPPNYSKLLFDGFSAPALASELINVRNNERHSSRILLPNRGTTSRGVSC